MGSFTEPQILPDYYKILEISPSAPQVEIRKAYRKLALKYHPDKNTNQCVIVSNSSNKRNALNEHFISINEAYNILSNAESRANYDIQRLTGNSTSNSGPSSTLENMHGLFREIMSYKETISELSGSFMTRSIELGWIAVSTEEQLFSTYEREISLIESSILAEPGESSTPPFNQYDDDLSDNYLPEDDIIQILENPQWIVIDKETLIRSHQLSDFVESQNLLIKSVSDIISPLMMACSYGTWSYESKVETLNRIKSLQLKIIQYLEIMNQKIETDVQAFDSIIDKITTDNIQEQIVNLSKHPIMNKISGGKFGQNGHPLWNIAAFIGPPFAGYSLYWSILCLIILGAVTVHFNEGDLESFKQFLDLFENSVALFDQIKS
ncbi:11906_t:CDS:2 [Dentiscutata heterogama]|uniref:11906_t:CDS:1 n=1 Tax=Dentiscutata heterogama TaxID=1316150 RepID=A0ACA9K499_9GLOM|nr:11906_t:CDS:2 [Dentiscutata heterogama]